MQKVIISTLLTIALTGCTAFPGVHKIDIHQGNLVTQEMVNKLKPGMTKSQVRFVLGSPLIIDTFQQNRWDYLKTEKLANQPRTQQRVTLFFENDRLTDLSGDLRPGAPSQP